MPDWPADAWDGQGARGHRRDPPARRRGRRLAAVGVGGARVAPAPQGERHDAGVGGRELQASRRGHVQRRQFPDHGAQAAASQAFLHRLEDLLVAGGVDIDDAVGPEPGLREGRRVEIALAHAPENLAGQSGRDTRRKGCRCRAENRLLAAAGDLVQGAAGEPVPRKDSVDGGYAEGKGFAGPGLSLLDAADLIAQARQRWLGRIAGLGGRSRNWFHVPVMFTYAAGSQRGEINGSPTALGVRAVSDCIRYIEGAGPQNMAEIGYLRAVASWAAADRRSSAPGGQKPDVGAMAPSTA